MCEAPPPADRLEGALVPLLLLLLLAAGSGSSSSSSATYKILYQIEKYY
jgi:hypothetical protein